MNFGAELLVIVICFIKSTVTCTELKGHCFVLVSGYVC